MRTRAFRCSSPSAPAFLKSTAGSAARATVRPNIDGISKRIASRDQVTRIGSLLLSRRPAKERIPEVARRNQSLFHESLVEFLFGEPVSESLPGGLPEIEDRRLAQMVSDRLGGPLGITVDRAARGVAGGAPDEIRLRRGAGLGKEIHVLRVIVHRLVEGEAAGVEPRVEADARVAGKLSLELVEALLPR